jgi:hypothetical protein
MIMVPVPHWPSIMKQQWWMWLVVRGLGRSPRPAEAD